MKTISCISHDQKDKDRIVKLIKKAKDNKVLHKKTSFSELAVSCVTEYLEEITKNLSTGKQLLIYTDYI